MSGAGGTAPKRIQLRRTKGWRLPEGAIVVSRPGLWGNPWPVEEAAQCLRDREEIGDPAVLSVQWYRVWIETQTATCGKYLPPTLAMIRERLGGHDLACWCALGRPCHADVLLELANGATP